MRVATLNLMHGRSLSDGVVEAQRLQGAVTSLAADVLGLQEVDRGQPRSHGLHQTQLAAAAMGSEHWRFVPALVGTPGGSWRAAEQDDSTEPSYGCALVSRYPVRAWRTIRLPAARVRSPILLPGSRRVVWLHDEPRVAVAAVVATPLGDITVATTHLSFVPGWNVVQLRRLCRELQHLPAPRLLLGDLNLPGRVPAAVSGWRTLARAATYPSTRPRVQLDHVLASGSLPAVRSFRTPGLAVSDHCALVVEL